MYLPSDSLSHGYGWNYPRVQPIWVTLGRAKMTKIHYLSYCRDFCSVCEAIGTT